MNAQFKARLKAGDPLIGIIQSLGCPEVTEIVALSGFDWVFIDLEHSALDVGPAMRLLQVCPPHCPGIVRVPAVDEAWTKRLLDSGASGIIFPLVNSVEQAARAVALCRYPPAGTRGVGISRAQGYGLKFKEYVDTANHEMVVILQIEHHEAVKNIEQIVKVPGIDALFIGPYDLSGSLGKIGQVDDAQVQEQIEKVRLTAQAAGVPLGIFTADPASVPGLIDKGYTLVALGIDTLFLSRTLAGALAGIKNNPTRR